MSELTSASVSRSTYDAAGEHFDAAPLRFWERYGEGTIARLGLAPGARVLDACSGSGASALPAARAVGPAGSVIGVDLSEPLLGLARQKAHREGHTHVRFVQADMTALDFADASFDAVVVVFGIFFAPDMAAQIRLFHRMLRPGGTLAVTTWGPRLFEPLYSPFLESVRARRTTRDEYRPWDRLSTVEQVSALMRTSPFEHVTVALEPGREPLERPEDWWTIVLGTGFRWFIDQLTPDEAEAVRTENTRRARDVSAVETNVIYAVGRK